MADKQQQQIINTPSGDTLILKTSPTSTTTTSNQQQSISPVKSILKQSINDNVITNNDDDLVDDEEYEYEEYEVDEDEEIDENKFIVKKSTDNKLKNVDEKDSKLSSSSSLNQSILKPIVTTIKTSKIPIEYEDENDEDEEIEYEDEEYEEEEEIDQNNNNDDNDEEYNRVANKIDELLNKTSNLKQESDNNKTQNDNKLILTLKPETKSSSSLSLNESLIKNDDDNKNENLSSLKHVSNKWNIADLNDDDVVVNDYKIEQPIITTIDSDNEDDDNNKYRTKNPILQKKLQIHNAIQADKKKQQQLLGIESDNFIEDDKEIDEIEIALEENFIKEEDEENFIDEDDNVNEKNDLNLNQDNKSKDISNNNNNVNNKKQNKLQQKFVQEFVENIITNAAAEVNDIKNNNSNDNDHNPEIIIDKCPTINFDSINDNNDVVPELSLNSQTTDLSKKYSIDLSGEYGLHPSSAYSNELNRSNTGGGGGGQWQILFGHLLLTFFVYVLYKTISQIFFG